MNHVTTYNILYYLTKTIILIIIVSYLFYRNKLYITTYLLSPSY
jgi:hypothetical protein